MRTELKTLEAQLIQTKPPYTYRAPMIESEFFGPLNRCPLRALLHIEVGCKSARRIEEPLVVRVQAGSEQYLLLTAALLGKATASSTR